MTTVERTFAMTKISAGNYLLPSNDAKTLWHIYSFVDGKSAGLPEPDRTYWGCARYEGTLAEAADAVKRDMAEFGYIQHDSGYPSYRPKWRETDTYLRTRADAIRVALTTTTREN